VNGVAAAHGRKQEQDSLLDVGAQVDQRHDLRDVCPANMAQTCQHGVVGDGPLTQQAGALVGQGQQPGNVTISYCVDICSRD
jgi:hypothetical protein